MNQRLLTLTLASLLTLNLVGCSSTQQSSKPDNAQQISNNGYSTAPLPAELQQKLNESMVAVKGGEFLMGSDAKSARKREKPVHQVELDDFYISKFEMTQDIFFEVMGWNSSYFRCDNCPINNLSHLQMKIFIDKLNARTGKQYRLPTEAEWEFAAKGGNQSKNYLFAGSDNIDDVAWYAGNAQRKNHAVGQKQPNELGLYDMTGNVWEICADDFDEHSYHSHAAKNPKVEINIKNAKIKMKVTRGSGYEFTEQESYVFMRDMVSDNVRMPDVGFRLAYDK